MKMMNKNISIHFEQEDAETADWMMDQAEKYLDHLDRLYGLPSPRKLVLVVLTSWISFPFQTAPWYFIPPAAIAFPFWALRAHRIWPVAGGWHVGCPGRTAAVGVKPPRLLESANRSLGDRLYLKIEDPQLKVDSLFAHELVHACSHHLRLPVWLHEGLAMAAVDHLMGQPTVRPESRDMVKASLLTPYRLKKAYQGRDHETLLALYAAGYWTVRWLEENRPDVLKDVLGRCQRRNEVDQRVAATFGCEANNLWEDVEEMLGRREN